MKNKTQRHLGVTPRKFRSHGFAMIEVLTSVVIISVGLLGLAGLQVAGMKGTQHANMKMQATLLTQNLVEKMRANPSGDYEQVVDCNNTLPKDCGLIAKTCDVNQLAVYHLYRAQCGTESAGQYYGGIKQLLGDGVVQVSCPSGDCDDGVTVNTTWNERALDENQIAVDGVVARTLQMSVQL